jgi:poly-beta-1,6-N-acetyl-D-glucosamine synthase
VIVILLLLIVWLSVGLFALGPPAFLFLYMTRSSKKKWPTKIDANYRPKISIIVPTFNEARIILLKLTNLVRLSYPRNLMQVIFVDSNSSDGTTEIIRQFCNQEPQMNAKILVEKKRKGKSNALNYALEHCNGEVIIVSDADCFWPSDILTKSMPFLADSTVGLIAGPKILLNAEQTWVTRMEQRYLESANILRLGESKAGSTVFFEGGFSAYKKTAIQKFDPHCTGSDDCGTAIDIIQKKYRAMLVPEATFYTTFPISLKNKLNIKLRRINQLIRVFAAYASLLLKNQIRTTKRTIVPNVFLYLVSPVAFIIMLILASFLVISFPYILLSMLLLLIPKFRFYCYQIFENNLLLFVGIIGVVVGKNFSIWNQPEDREWLTTEILNQFNLLSRQ